MRNSRAFTLIEIIVAVALVAILSAAIAPSVLNNIAQGRMTRAKSDVQALAQAIQLFRNDTGVWPNRYQPASTADPSLTFNFLATRGPVGPTDAATGDDYWPTLGTGLTGKGAPQWPMAFQDGGGAASSHDITRVLIGGESRDGSDNQYTRIPFGEQDDPTAAGFRGPVVGSDPLDPWGHRYMSNVVALDTLEHPVWVISAGPDGIIDTYVSTNGLAADSTLIGDDIGYRMR